MTRRDSVLLVSIPAVGWEGTTFGCHALASYIRHHDLVPSVAVLEAGAEPDVEAVVAELMGSGATVIGFGLYVWNVEPVLEVINRYRSEGGDAFVVVGGPQVSRDLAVLRSALDHGRIDLCVVGEGEVAMRVILMSAEAPRGFYDGESVADLADLPIPYIDSETLSAEALGGTYIVQGSRGCPYKCTFCDQGWRSARYRKIETVLDEIRLAASLGARRLVFLDPTFNAPRKRMATILGAIARELPGTTLEVEVKVDALSAQDCALLTSVPVEIEVGLQTSNLATLERVRRRQNLNKLWMNVAELRRRGATVVVNTIYGLPGENLADWCQTIDDCFRNCSAIVSSTCLKLLPNTEIWTDRSRYLYAWDERRMWSATRSIHMPRSEFEYAARLSQILSALQLGDREPLNPVLREAIDRDYDGSLSTFMIDFNDGRVALGNDWTLRPTALEGAS